MVKHIDSEGLENMKPTTTRDGRLKSKENKTIKEREYPLVIE
jgi:hypothetical protein